MMTIDVHLVMIVDVVVILDVVDVQHGDKRTVRRATFCTSGWSWVPIHGGCRRRWCGRSVLIVTTTAIPQDGEKFRIGVVIVGADRCAARIGIIFHGKDAIVVDIVWIVADILIGHTTAATNIGCGRDTLRLDGWVGLIGSTRRGSGIVGVGGGFGGRGMWWLGHLGRTGTLDRTGRW